MTAFSTTDLAAMQATQDAHMMDTCRLLTYSSSVDGYGLPTASYAAGSEIACGFRPASRDEIQSAGQVVVADAELRLPIATALDSRDRVRITQRFGVAVSNVDYDLIGTPRRGPSGLVVTLQRVTDGS